MPGSGKTTLGKLLAKKFGLKFYSMGDLRGKMALEHGLTLEELNKLGEKEKWTDEEIDSYTKKIGKTEDNFIVEGRLAYHFIPDSIKIFIDVRPQVGAERILANPRPDEKSRETLKDEMEATEERIKSDKKRYEKLSNGLSNYILKLNKNNKAILYCRNKKLYYVNYIIKANLK